MTVFQYIGFILFMAIFAFICTYVILDNLEDMKKWQKIDDELLDMDIEALEMEAYEDGEIICGAAEASRSEQELPGKD